MANLNSLGFKFKLGEIVHHKLVGYNMAPAEKPRKTRMLVLERIAQECPGGVQLHYICRVATDVSLASATIDPSHTYQFMEQELEV